ncbi:hypothetical protein IP81_12995 [Novosphingobium sp. AAP83]|uniref:hypothetical protein n=1 Tax=Novosphingobium sp. AAP83 TaxID=1523425 RepID=UPI0006B9F599|nr:hypothetical protein [Novosphingobium sp. AAP83]KPF91105.1 hypothetical protein IP81_12995 [Novosphingobium sp. AAP83]
MWLDRDAYHARQQAPCSTIAAPIQASYRRGILRTKVNVCDLSCTAAAIDGMENPPVGTLVWLTLPGLEARAAIVETSEDFRAFIRFAQPFHPAVLDAFLNGSIRSYH